MLLLFAVAKVETLPVGGTAPGFATFPTVPFLFTYKPDVDVVKMVSGALRNNHCTEKI